MPRNRKKKHCAFMDKPCLGKDCKIHHTRFDRCAVELLPDNLYFHKQGMTDLLEATRELIHLLEPISDKLDAEQ
jgi:hypothetical protein